jgi:hypothetical protein
MLLYDYIETLFKDQEMIIDSYQYKSTRFVSQG